MRTCWIILVLSCTIAASQTGKAALPTDGFTGGLIVHLHCGDGVQTATLPSTTNCVVHALDTDLEQVEAARKRLKSAGRYGQVTVGWFDGKRLPYTDNLVNLIVIGDTRHEIRDEELKRVLAPRGRIIAPKGTRIPHPASGTVL